MSAEISSSSEFFDKRKQQIRPEALEGLGRLGRAPGLRIAGARTNSNDSVRFDLQSNPDGPAITLGLRRVGEEWRVDRF